MLITLFPEVERALIVHDMNCLQRCAKHLHWRLLVSGSDCNVSTCSVGDVGWEDPLEEGMTTHSSILAWRIPMERAAWQTTVHGVTKSDTTE